jgi:hypothetical protein
MGENWRQEMGRWRCSVVRWPTKCGNKGGGGGGGGGGG